MAGEPIVLGIGGTLGGYASDTTRTVWVTGRDGGHSPDAAFLDAHDLVRRAHAAATALVRPGVSCEAVDDAARGVIAAGGHGPDFLGELPRDAWVVAG